VTPATASTATGWPASLPPTTAYFTYDLGSAGTSPAAITLTGASINNPNILNASNATFTRDTDWDGGQASPTPAAAVTRWNSASSFSSLDTSHVTAAAITGLNAVALPTPLSSSGPPTGVDTNVHTGLASLSFTGEPQSSQPGYDAAHNTFLVGTVTFTVVSNTASTQLKINPSTLNPPTSVGSAIGTSNATGSAPNFVPTVNNLANAYALGTATIVRIGGGIGDFTGRIPGVPDGNRNQLDIDWLYKDIRNHTTTPNEDLSGNGIVNQVDVDKLVNTYVDLNGGSGQGTRYGDANLDGAVTGTDFNAFLDRPPPIGWASGDWSGDGFVTGTDFNLFLDRPTAIGSGSLAPVPEPASFVLLLAGILCGIALIPFARRLS